jgi:hypothetical protein
MLYADKVNADPRIFCPQDFCEFFPAFATIPRFQNPIKYSGRFEINHRTVHFAPASRAMQWNVIVCYQCVMGWLKNFETCLRYNGR